MLQDVSKTKFCPGVTVVACARWEEQHICEWLDYHQSIGIDQVFLYCNDDDPVSLYEKVRPYTLGWRPYLNFIHYPFPGQQYWMYRHFLVNQLQECEWILFLDIDEFLYPGELFSIRELTDNLPVDLDCLHLNRLMFGTSDFYRRPEGSVLLSYFKREATINPFAKTLTRACRIDLTKLAYGQVMWHHWTIPNFEYLSQRNVLGDDVSLFSKNFPHQITAYLNKEDRSQRIAQTACIFHFFRKSEQDALRRIARGTLGNFSEQGRRAGLAGSRELLEFKRRTNNIVDLRLRDYWAKVSGCRPIVSALLKSSFPKEVSITKASQSSYINSAESNAAAALNGVFTGRSSFHTAAERSPWWAAEFDGVHIIHELRIFNRMDSALMQERFLIFYIESLDEEGKWSIVERKMNNQMVGGVDGNPFKVIWQDGLKSCGLRIVKEGYGFLHLDQIEIYGYR